MEWLGVLASLVIIYGFTRKNEQRIRMINIVGASLYVAYGVFVGSFSNIFLNLVLIGVNLYRLWRDQEKK